MKLKLCWIGKTKAAAVEALTAEFVKRLGRYLPTETQEFRTEAALLDWASRERGRLALVMLDARGRQMTSEELAHLLRSHQEAGVSLLAFAVGPADGWSDAARHAGTLLLSLSRMTLAHEIARVVLAEQLYRGFSILAGHPYHLGHSG